MNKIIFEHPLNEKIRIGLRIEFLLQHLYANSHCNQNNALLFFHSLSELLDIIERNDVRGDLIKEIESQKQKLSLWMDIDGVDHDVLSELLVKLNSFLSKLNASPRLGHSLKEDRFIASIRQRLMIPGGCCSFDLPLFHLWLKLPQEKRNIQVQNWLEHFSVLNEALSTCLQLTRQLSEFKPFTYHNSFFQDAGGEVSLIRIRINSEQNVYPQVSGHMTRYSIRFLPLDANDDIKNETIEFELACC